MSYIENMISEVEKTHKNFGKLVAVCQIATKARKFTLVVSPSGCGKSRAMAYVGNSWPDNWMPTSLSVSSLVSKVDKLTSFRSTIVIDDIATIQTPYSRQTTITTLSQLCYSHRVEPSMVGFDFAIEDFYGSALVGIQPIILKDLMIAPEWDASIQDKALRYYHVFRPLVPNLDFPSFKLERGIDFDSVEDFELDINSEYWHQLISLAYIQWSKARAKEHIVDFLKAISALEGRKTVIYDDYKLLAELLKPMALEAVVVTKDSLEGERYLNNNLLALLVEYYTYGGEFYLASIAQDFQISMSQAYRIMATQNGSWQQVQKSPTYYRPSTELQEILQSLKLDIAKKSRGGKK